MVGMVDAKTTGGRRGRPRAFDRDTALEAAKLLFWERGYEATSVGDLTDAMGIRPGSLYAAFGDKKSLFKEAVRSYGRSRVGALMARALDEEPTARGAFERILREAAVAYCDPGHPAGCLTISAATNISEQDEEVGQFLREIRNGNLTTFESRLSAAVAGGELPPSADPPALAAYFAAIIQGMSQRSRDGATEQELTETARMAMLAWPT
ncbi:TetR/AcrR family transcriptional regulator [Streptomyces sp. NPDC050560]|uniref:TetR/AcrR family transcriptional regulator n=1 Tax=Streptomyces sp. NPDC050560 TaxID=3365630 RepID=UPI00379E85A9